VEVDEVDRYSVAEVPEMSVDGLVVERFVVGEVDGRLSILRSMFSHGEKNRGVPPGEYTRLSVNGMLWMSDTPAEVGDLLGLFSAVRGASEAKGECSVLLHGLGLGVALKGCFENGATKVTVVERDSRVLEHVGGFWKSVYGERLELILGDAYAWKPEPGVRWDCVWHDVWANICSDNLESMKKLHRRFGRRCDWQGSWCRAETRRAAKRGW